MFCENPILDKFVERSYEVIVKSGYSVLPESFKEINYGINFKMVSPAGKTIAVAVYHTPKNGFSIVSSDKDIKALLQLLISGIGTAGCDEAGKGDFFGPLVAASFVMGEKEAELLKLGIKDSKKMKTEEIIAVHRAVSSKYKDSFSVVKIMPERYNSFYKDLSDQGKNLNNLLTWAHSKALSSLCEKRSDIKKVVVDRFTQNRFLLDKISSSSKSAPVEFMTRAESIPSVAIASIIARAEYLNSLKHISETLLESKFKLISGSGTASDTLLKEIIDCFGDNVAQKICKTHFFNYSKQVVNSCKES
jgi:ribonuclease HIII